MKIFLMALVVFIVIAVIAGMSSLGRKGKDKWTLRRGGGKSMLDDFDEERKNIDQLMK